jgi:WS/DGAT/MGAT family acyltransferase
VWVDDHEFDIAYHVRLTALPRPGSEAQLLALMERLQSQLLDRRRPLWEIWFVEGAMDDRVAIIQKTHHCLIDGVSGIDVATVLLDLEPDPPPIEVPEWVPEPPPESGALLVESLIERVVEPAELVRSVRAALRVPQHASEQVTGMFSTVKEAGGGRPETPFNVPITPHRRMELARVPLEQVKAIKNAAGCTINDVVLTACSMALRSFLQARDALTPGLVLKAMVPVSVRDESEQMALGNRVSMLVAELPVAEPDGLEQLEYVAAHMDAAKHSGQAVGADTLVALAGFAPPTLLGLAARLAPRALPVNTVITNIPGPQFPLYCMGARVLEAFPYVNMIDNLALIIAVISYDGQLSFGVSSDRSAVPDVDLVARRIGESFDELYRALELDQPAEAELGA